MTDLAPFASAVFSALRGMDAEAKTICVGKRLAALLTAAGFPARAECRYPGLPGGKRNSCDVVVELPGDWRLWLELKGAWRDYWAARGGLLIYRSYLLHPLVRGLDPKSHTVPQDLDKLARLAPADATVVAALLLGFEADDDPMDQDVAELVRLAKLGQAPWITFTDHWPATHQRCGAGCGQGRSSPGCGSNPVSDGGDFARPGDRLRRLRLVEPETKKLVRSWDWGQAMGRG